ncbi:MAG: hypothetical protein L0H74_15330 [Brachybacterium sp.]|nr:hypothetical protein [Brachybacterium sp.]
MESTSRSSASRINVVVGTLVMLVGILAAIAAVVLSLVLETAGFLALLIPAALALGGGAFVLWGARRSRLRIDADGFVWAGFIGAQRSVRWQVLEQLVPPAPGDRRLVTTALLRDGSRVPVRALWEPATVPSASSGGADHSEVQNALLSAHRRWLAGNR